jgi:hypothetical protein
MPIPQLGQRPKIPIYTAWSINLMLILKNQNMVYPGFEPGPSRSEVRNANHNKAPVVSYTRNFLSILSIELKITMFKLKI